MLCVQSNPLKTPCHASLVFQPANLNASIILFLPLFLSRALCSPMLLERSVLTSALQMILPQPPWHNSTKGCKRSVQLVHGAPLKQTKGSKLRNGLLRQHLHKCRKTQDCFRRPDHNVWVCFCVHVSMRVMMKSDRKPFWLSKAVNISTVISHRWRHMSQSGTQRNTAVGGNVKCLWGSDALMKTQINRIDMAGPNIHTHTHSERIQTVP